ncbi:MAG: flagellin FliC [Deltaproteobacteria bacterium]|nr:flagellin FliC [Deltaproteobacteria bacterium]
MPLAIQANLTSLEARRHLATAGQSVETSYARLSSGFRINSAADDAAGLSVSETLSAQVRAIVVAERNARNAIGMTQTADSSLGQLSDLLIRMRELAVQAANGEVSSGDRSILDDEFQLLKLELDRLAQSTRFNGKDLLGGTPTAFDFQVGTGNTSSDVITVVFGGVSVSNFGLSASSLAGADRLAAFQAIGEVDAAIAALNAQRAAIGSAQNRLGVSEANSAVVRTNLTASTSLIRDVDIAEESSRMARGQVLMQAGTSILAQANMQGKLALSLLGGTG